MIEEEGKSGGEKEREREREREGGEYTERRIIYRREGRS